MYDSNAIKLIKTDLIVARYAKLAVTEPAHRFLVQVMEPLEMAAVEYKITFSDFDFHPEKDTDWDTYALEALKKQLLEEWHNYAHLDWVTEDEMEWVLKIDKVKLIDCDLLVPKRESLGK